MNVDYIFLYGKICSFLLSSVIYLNFDHKSVYKVYTVEFVVS